MVKKTPEQRWADGSWLMDLGKALQRATKNYVTPSQVDTFRDCPRKWAWSAIHHLPAPQARSAELGDATHNQLETYLKGGQLDFTKTTPNWAKPGLSAELASTALPHLPPPLHPTMEVETGFSQRLTLDGPFWGGRIDWLNAFTYAHIGLTEGPDAARFCGVTIGDHKTTSALEWAKTPEVLMTDTQALVYARWALDRFQVDHVDLQWTYILTKGPRYAEPRRVRLTRAHVDAAFQQLETIAKEMVQLKLHKTPALDLPANPESCEKYGGCPFRANCNLSPSERRKAIMSVPSLPGPSNFAQIQQAMGITPPGLPGLPTPAAVAPQTPTAPAAPTFNPALLASMGLMSQSARRDEHGRVTHDFRGMPLPPNVIGTQQVRMPSGGYRAIDPIDLEIANALQEAAGDFQKYGQAPGTIQPGQPTAPAPVAPSLPAAPQVPQQTAPVTQAWTPPGPLPTPAASTPAAPQPPPAWQPPAMPTGPINPPESALPPAPATGLPAPTTMVAPASPAPAAQTPAEKRKATMEAKKAAAGGTPAPTAGPAPTQPTNPGAGSLYLFIGARPTKGRSKTELTDLAVLVTQANELIQTEEGDEFQDWGTLPYGTGPGALSNALEEVITKQLAKGDLHLYVQPHTREFSAARMRLFSLATVVVEGGV